MATRKRNHKITVWMNDEEYNSLIFNSRACCLSESDFVRLLVRGYEPKVKLDKIDDFLMQLNKLANNVNQIRAKANALNFIDAPALKTELKNLRVFQANVEAALREPDKVFKEWL